jgi:hypothetical protein
MMVNEPSREEQDWTGKRNESDAHMVTSPPNSIIANKPVTFPCIPQEDRIDQPRRSPCVATRQIRSRGWVDCQRQ